MIWENHADKSVKKPKELVEKPVESACRGAEDVVGAPVDSRFVSAWRGAVREHGGVPGSDGSYHGELVAAVGKQRQQALRPRVRFRLLDSQNISTSLKKWRPRQDSNL